MIPENWDIFLLDFPVRYPYHQLSTTKLEKSHQLPKISNLGPFYQILGREKWTEGDVAVKSHAGGENKLLHSFNMPNILTDKS